MISSDQIAKNYDIAGVRKANLPGLHMLLLGFFAGMFIALAGPDRIRPRFPGRTCDGYLQRQ